MKRTFLTSLGLLYCSCVLVHNTGYEAVTTWTILFVNSRNYPVSILVLNDSTVDSYSKPTRLDSLDMSSVLVSPGSSLKLTLTLSSLFVDEEPHVQKESDFLFHMQVDSAGVNSGMVDIDLFPFPKYADHVLCSEYYYYDSDTSQVRYQCSSLHEDTLTLSADSVISTMEYSNWIPTN